MKEGVKLFSLVQWIKQSIVLILMEFRDLTHGALVSPSGVACDCDGYIYVCETQQSSIHILSPDGAGHCIIKEGLTRPLALSVNSNSTELAVTRNFDVCTKLLCLKFSYHKCTINFPSRSLPIQKKLIREYHEHILDKISNAMVFKFKVTVHFQNLVLSNSI